MVEEALFLIGVREITPAAEIPSSFGGDGVFGRSGGPVATDWPRRLCGSEGWSDMLDMGKKDSEVDVAMNRGGHKIYLVQI